MEQDIEKNKGNGGINPAVIAIVAAVVVFVVIVVTSQKGNYRPVTGAMPAIDFTLPDLDGNLHSLSEFRGKVVFLNFWATWCKPCEEELPSMQFLYDAMKGNPFEIVAISIDKEPSGVVRDFAKKYKITFTVLHDRKGKIKELYKTTGVPETFIIDQNGVIAEKVVGPRNWTKKDNLVMILDLVKNGPKPASSYR